MQVSDDCRWLLTSSLDGTVRCWDIPGELAALVGGCFGGVVCHAMGCMRLLASSLPGWHRELGQPMCGHSGCLVVVVVYHLPLAKGLLGVRCVDCRSLHGR